jgi:meso-butanediol dehydrogenase/(S,S)-butanediol dehydrogenase/diacetyl reductase
VDPDALTGKVCAVVGASAGIGRATARRLAADGAMVVMIARGEQRLTEAAREVGPAAVPFVADTSDPQSVRATFAAIGNRFGHLDILINVAGVARLTLIEDATDDDVDYVMRTNLFGPLYTTRAAIPLMRRTAGGVIVNVSSEATTDAMPYNTLYGISKAGLNALSTLMNHELRETGIRVCLCVAGRTSGTAFADNFTPEQWAVARAAAQASGYYARVAGSVAMTPDEVADALAFVVSRPVNQMLDVVHVRASR